MTNDDNEEERAAFIDAETCTELLQEGECEITLFEPDGEDDLEADTVRLTNTSGPHPLYSGSFQTESDRDTPTRYSALRHGIPIAMLIVVTTAWYWLVPTFNLTINGTTTTLPPEDPLLLVVSLTIALAVYLSAVVVPRMEVGRGGGRR